MSRVFKDAMALSDLAARLGCQTKGDDNVIISGVASLSTAKTGDIVFVKNKRYLADNQNSKASATIVHPSFADQINSPLILSENPKLTFIRVFEFVKPAFSFQAPFVDDSAVVHHSAVLGENVHVGANVVIGAGVKVGSGTVLASGVVLGDNVQIGEDCLIYANVVIYYDCIIGNRVIIHSTAVIGADGFGFERDGSKGWVKLPHVGAVLIGSDVELGAGTMVDRGALDNTVIEDGVKIDNLVHIAHNVFIGKNTIIAGTSAIAGSSRIGCNCVLGGNVCVSDGLSIVDGTLILARASISKSITDPVSEGYSSIIPARPSKEWAKQLACLRRLPANQFK